MTELERHEDIARRAADQAIERVFKLLFGVDLEEQAQINEFRADLEHMRRQARWWVRGQLLLALPREHVRTKVTAP